LILHPEVVTKVVELAHNLVHLPSLDRPNPDLQDIQVCIPEHDEQVELQVMQNPSEGNVPSGQAATH